MTEVSGFGSKLAAAAFGLVLAAASVGSAQAITMSPWSISGPDSSTEQLHPSKVSLDYDTRGFKGNWIAETTALEDGLLKFEWLYNGFHAYNRVRVDLVLETPDGTKSLASGYELSCCGTIAGGFSFKGYEEVALAAGEKIRLLISGSNYDSTDILRGSIEVSQVPLPAAAPLLAVALAGLGYVGRRKKAQAA